MTTWCARCGNDLPIEPGLPCELCWPARADTKLIRELADWVDRGAHRAPRLLARIGDPQALPALRWAASHGNPRVRAAALASIGWSGGEAEVPVAVAALEDPDIDVREAARATLADLGGGHAVSALAGVLDQLELNERLHALQALRWLEGESAGNRPTARGDPGVGESAGVGEPPGGHVAAERVLPRLTLAKLSTQPLSGVDWPPAKFGGQPDWTGPPAWPVADDLRPLVFYGQLPLAGYGRRTAYLFFRLDPDAESWEPLGQGNALVLQPGEPCQLQTVAQATGPRLFERVAERRGFRRRSRARPYERFVGLEPGVDPEHWDAGELDLAAANGDAHGDWNKIGGTPQFLQPDGTRPGPGWEFAFQFTAAWAGHELANGAECYGFVRGGKGALLWQSP